MIQTAELASLLDDGHVLRLLDDADQTLVARGARAVHARVGVCDVVARRAVRDALLDVANGVAEMFGVLARMPQDVKGQTLGALASDAGQLLQLLDEPG